MNVTRYILALFLLFCYSCNNEGSVVYNIEDPPLELSNNLEGYGCSPSTVCYPLSEIYYDFSSQALYQGFYKFDKAWSEGGYHNPETDTLGLYTFNNSYLMAVPSSYIESDGENNTVIISNDGSFIFQELDDLSDLPSDLVELESQPPIPRFKDELLLLSSNPLSNISNVIWNSSQLRYVPNTTASKVYNKLFYFTQEYDSIIQTTLIDTGNTPIIDDIILLDYNEIVQRTVTLYDTINTVEPVKAKRNVSFRIKNTYVSNDGPYWQENTDCNDNYQKDDEEVVLFDGYVNSYGINPKSFEAWCLMDACIGEGSENFSLSEQECCNNNSYGYGCTDNSGNIDYSIDANSSNPEQLCCMQNLGVWDPNATCLDTSGETLPDWDGSQDGCDDNTSQTEWDYGLDWDHDGIAHNPVGFCFGFETLYSNEADCLSSSATWVASQGTEDIPQTGQDNEDDSDDIAIGCSNGGESSSNLYDDCDNSSSNTSETDWNYGTPWDHDDTPYIPAYCILNEDNCLAINLTWTSVLGGGFCSENNLTENECFDLTNTSFSEDSDGDNIDDSCSNGGSSESGIFDDCSNSTWISEEGTPNESQDGSADEPIDDDIPIGCTNSGTSYDGNYLDCDNSTSNTSETLWDYGEPWNHDNLAYVQAYCFSTNQEQCDYCADTEGQDTGENYDSCTGQWMDWQEVVISPNIPQTGEFSCSYNDGDDCSDCDHPEGYCENSDDDVAIGCDNGGTSELGNFDDCNNSSGTWAYVVGYCSGTDYEWKWIPSEWDESDTTCSNSTTTWDDSIEFNINSNSLCLSTCVKNNSTTSMDDFCWDYYDGNISYLNNNSMLEDYDRLSGHCLVDQSEIVSSGYDGEEYDFAFCDTGNNLFDLPEYFYDTDEDGLFTIAPNYQEAYEDRNCNQKFDGQGFNANFSDLPYGNSGYIGDELFTCDDSYQLSGVGLNKFCDRGNGMWDPPETHYCSPDLGINCEYTGDSNTLFKRSDAPEIFLVNYEDWNAYYESYDAYAAALEFYNTGNELREPLGLQSDGSIAINPSSDFEDTGIDGCYDELEDGNGGCLCEFKNDELLSQNNPSITDCEDLFEEWYPDSWANVWKQWHQIGRDANGNFLSAEIIITEFDIGLSEFSAFNYGECANGFSGSLKDCCEYYGCSWDGEVCTWSAEECVNNTFYCSNNITLPCENDFDCGNDLNSCSISKWVENIDPNDDNYWSNNGCYYNGACESDILGSAPILDETKTQFNNNWETGEETELFANSTGLTISAETYSNSPGLYSDYVPHVALPDYIITKKHLYSDNNNNGNDTLFVVDEQMKSVTVIVSNPIIESRNTIKSRKVIDQAGYGQGGSSDFCDIAYQACLTLNPSYSECLEDNTQSCIYDSEICMIIDDESECLASECLWGNSTNDCSDSSSDYSCYHSNDINLNNICDDVENSCSSTVEFENCLSQLSIEFEQTFFQDLLSDFYIMKTEYGYNDYDYLLFNRSDDYIIKMTHPYYHFQSNNNLPTDIDDFVCEGEECVNFWENTLLKPDTLLYSHDGNIIDGQIFISSETIETNNGTYFVEKDYQVNSGVAELEYAVYNPALYNSSCDSYNNEIDCCGEGDLCGLNNNCSWETPPEYNQTAFEAYCTNKSSSLIEDCLIVTRIVNTTSIGPGQGFGLRTKTYLKPGYKILKETLEISWDTSPWLDGSSNWSFISGIEFRNSTSAIQTNATPDNFLVDYQTIDFNDFEESSDFNYSPFRINRTMGLMRYE